jgi:capsular polysaccharide biosynthesis protein
VEREELDIRTVLLAMRRRWRIMLLGIVAGLVLATLVTMALPKTYATESKVNLGRRPTGGNPTEIMRSEAARANRSTMAQRVIDALGLNDTVDEMLKKYKATATTDDVLVFTVQGPTADASVERANKFAEEFLTMREERLDEDLRTENSARETKVKELEAKIQAIDDQLPGAEKSITQYDALIRQKTDLIGQQTTLQNRIDDARTEVALAKKNSYVLQDALKPKAPIKPSLQFNLVLGLVAGLAVAGTYVLVKDVLSGKLRTRDAIAEAVGAPVLAGFSAAGGSGGSKGVSARAATRPGAQLIRAARAVVNEFGPTAGPDTPILIASVEADGEAALLALTVANLLADLGRGSLMLADASLLRPPMPRLLQTAGALPEGASIQNDDGEVARCFMAVESPSGAQHWDPVGGRAPAGDLVTLLAPADASKLGSDAPTVVAFLGSWEDPDEAAALRLSSDRLKPRAVVVVGAGRSTHPTIYRHVATLGRFGVGVQATVVAQPDRFDVTTGRPAVNGAHWGS